MLTNMSNDEIITEFVSITGIDSSVAQQYLSRNDFKLDLAINDYYQNENVEPGTKRGPSPETKSYSNKQKPLPSRFKSFSDLNGGTDENPEDDDMNFFTGGEKSGLAVENPNKPRNGRSLVDDLLEKAQREAGEPDWREEEEDKRNEGKRGKSFKGTGHSLGSVENAVESRIIADPAQSPMGFTKSEKVTRTITFWKEGFNVDDGDLYRYDDPQNQEYLEQLKVGKAPLSLLNVQMFQDVDVNVIKKIDESYHDNKKSKPRVYGFQGSGQRLGSPVPGEPTTLEEAIEVYGSPEEDTNKHEISVEEGDTSIQVRFADGSKVVKKFKSSSKVETIFEFVTGQSTVAREWTLVTSFPPKPLDGQKDQTIEAAGLKNSVVIQKWL